MRVKQPPVYKESFQLLIPPPNADSLSNPLLGQIASLSGGRADESYYATQLDLLESNKLLTPVVSCYISKWHIIKIAKKG